MEKGKKCIGKEGVALTDASRRGSNRLAYSQLRERLKEGNSKKVIRKSLRTAYGSIKSGIGSRNFIKHGIL